MKMLTALKNHQYRTALEMLEALINETPTGTIREHLTNANIMLMHAQQLQQQEDAKAQT